MDVIHLDHAPITEALIDIQCVIGSITDPSEILRTLKEAHSKIRADFPTIQSRVMRRINVPGDQAIVEDLTSGYLYRSSDGRRVVQFRVNGFTLSHLKPYKDWSSLFEETKRLWQVYTEPFSQIVVKRLAVRYINHIKVPFPLPQNDDYLIDIRKPLTTPHETSLIRSFAEQTSSTEQSTNTRVNFVRLMGEPASNATEAHIVIDIDVFKTVPDFSLDDPKIWDIIGSFREIKNRIFFAAVGPKTIAQYK